MPKQYGIVKIDYITYTTGASGVEADHTIDVSGLAGIADSGITVTGTISGISGIFASGIQVDGSGVFQHLYVSGNTILSGDVTASGDLGVSGQLTASSITSTGDINASGDIHTDSDLTVSGQGTLSGLLVTGDATIGNDLTVSGDLNVSGDITVSGITVTGNADFQADISVSGDLELSGGLVVSGLEVTGDADFQNDVSISGDLEVSGELVVSGLEVTGDADFQGGVTISGELSGVSGTLTQDLFVGDRAANSGVNIRSVGSGQSWIAGHADDMFIRITNTAQTTGFFVARSSGVVVGGELVESGHVGLYSSGAEAIRASGRISGLTDGGVYGSGYWKVPSGTSAERPASGVSLAGMLRYNTTLDTYEGHDGTTWGPLGVKAINSLNGGPLAGLRNHLINGDFRIWQRGTTYDVTANQSAYTADRWEQFAVGTNATGSISNNTKPSFATAAYSLNAGGGTIQQGVELPTNGSGHGRCGPFAVGTQWTFSVWSNQDLTGQSSIFRFRDGVGATPNQVEAASVIPNWRQVTTTADNGFHQYAITVTIDGAPVNSNRCFNVNLPDANSLGSAVAYAMAQLEPGPVATPFEQRPYGLELSLCQRYYVRVESSGSANLASGYARTNAESRTTTSLPVPLRGAPTFTRSAPSTFAVAYLTTAKACSDLVGLVTNDKRSVRFAGTSTGMTPGHGVSLVANGVCWYAFNAEL